MIDTNALAAKHQKEMEEALCGNELLSHMPCDPKRVISPQGKQPWVIYDRVTLQEAIDLYKQFGPTVPYEYRSGTFGYIGPHEYLNEKDDKAEVKLRSEGCPYLDGANSHRGRATTELVFFWLIPGMEKVVRVVINIAHASLYPKVVALNDHNRCVTFRKDYPNVGEDKQVHWAHGDNSGARCTWLWCYEDGFLASMRTYLGYID